MPGFLSMEFEYRGKRYKDAEKGLQALAGSTFPVERAGPAVSQELRAILNGLADAMGQQHGGGWPGGTSVAGARPGSLSRRSGRLTASIKRSVRVSGDLTSEIQGLIGSDLVYARTHEFGARIRARRAKYLTIPLKAALNSDGTPKRRSAREWDNTFVQESKAGNLIIFQKRGKRIVPLYVLKQTVFVPPRLGLGDALQKGAPDIGDRLIQTVLKEIVKPTSN